jgi:hypothetical protein
MRWIHPLLSTALPFGLGLAFALTLTTPTPSRAALAPNSEACKAQCGCVAACEDALQACQKQCSGEDAAKCTIACTDAVGACVGKCGDAKCKCGY